MVRPPYSSSDRAADLSLACESFRQALEMGAPLAVDCRAETEGVSQSITVSYWAPDYIDSVVAVVVASGDGMVPAGHARALFERLIARLLGDDAAAQVDRRIDDSACRPAAPSSQAK